MQGEGPERAKLPVRGPLTARGLKDSKIETLEMIDTRVGREGGSTELEHKWATETGS